MVMQYTVFRELIHMAREKNGIIRNKRWTCERMCSGRRVRYSAAYPTGRERMFG